MDTLPSRIGKFEILSLIGRGAMGTVYKARDPYIDRMVALKRISLSEFLPDDQKEEFKVRFFVEARAAGGLKHPNIVTIHDVDEADGVPFMAMEFLEGGSLTKLMKERGALPMDEASAMVRQVALGLAYAHERGIVHRDIKPDNILLDRNGRVVITDFGAAHLNTSDLTRTGEVLGTPHYMSPEQILGDPVDGRSDLFSLGVVFYLLVTGRRPFKGDTVSSVCYHIIHSSPEPVPEDLHVPSRAVPVLQKLLAKGKSERYQTGLELVEALNDLTAEVTSPVEWTRTQSLDSAPAPPVGFDTPSVPTGTAVGSLPSAQSSRPVERAVKPGGKGLWIALAIGSGALVVVFALVVTGILVVMGMRRAKIGGVPPPASQQQAEPASPAAPPASPPQQQISPGAEPPVRPSLPMAKTQGAKPPGPWHPPPSTPERPAPVVPSPSPQVLAATEVLLRDAGQVAGLAERRRFGKAFALLDIMQARLNQLKSSATPQDEAAIRRASEAAEYADRQARAALAAVAKPILEQGNAAVDRATDRPNTDEDAVIAAFADVYPVIRWKDRLPDDARLSVEEFMRRCRGELNDDEWAQAHALAQGRAFPGQN
jgi:serine/threonine-protein kinase